MKRDRYVAITGGLGNQLFQIAAGLANNPNSLFVISCLGDPRSTQFIPDIAAYDFQGKIQFINCTKKHKISKKFFSLFLSTSGRRNIINRNSLLRFLLQILGTMIFSTHFKKFLVPKVPNGSGYDESFSKRRGNLLIGYFQTFRIPDEVMTFMYSLRLKDYSELLDYLSKIAQQEEPVVIHVRRGDYKSENAFGILDQQYYEKALAQITLDHDNDLIWLFSDEPAEAKKALPSHIKTSIKEVDPGNLHPTTTLEIMRLGHNYIIANSSFSWWAAKLSRVEKKVVVAPKPWFVSAVEPIDLIPKDWIRISRN
jgi:hypothetical protein